MKTENDKTPEMEQKKQQDPFYLESGKAISVAHNKWVRPFYHRGEEVAYMVITREVEHVEEKVFYQAFRSKDGKALFGKTIDAQIAYGRVRNVRREIVLEQKPELVEELKAELGIEKPKKKEQTKEKKQEKEQVQKQEQKKEKKGQERIR